MATGGLHRAEQETVAGARELLGGRGIRLDRDVGRFVADAEAVWPERLSRSIERPVMGETLMRAVVVLGSRRPRANSRLAWRT
jgi:hypothetical protein